MRRRLQTKTGKIIILASYLTLIIIFWRSLPSPLFSDPTSTLLESRDGQLLSAIIAEDMQWRFPESKHVPEKFETCLLAFEDRYFHWHPGINPVSVYRALKQNIRQRERVSGASTISMQVIRMSRKNKARTIKQKLIESILAVRMEMKYSKEKILKVYASHAPFGGNVVGLDAAAWRYYGRPAGELSWGESATLAVLPNAPSLIFPGKNKTKLRNKRNRLLKKLLKRDKIDSTTYRLALLEDLPGKPHELPQNAIHLLTRLINEGKKGKRLKTTLDYQLQRQLRSIAAHHQKRLNNNSIQNLSILVLDNRNNKVISYIGNVISGQAGENGEMIDIITAPRSTGSILKPFLFAGMQDKGLLLPEALVSDIPAVYGNYRPENYNHQFTGAIPASKALSRSLNVPAVHMLSHYGVPRFYNNLKELGIQTLQYSPEHYGLSLILGGAEATLWDLTNAYAGFSKRLLNEATENDTNHISMDKADYLAHSQKGHKSGGSYPYSSAAAWLTLEAIQKTNRPAMQTGWENFYSSPVVAWKTGTSHGNRDAWAIGIGPEYTVGVWSGNADGEGRPKLTGVNASAPVLFHVFELLQPKKWFHKPSNMKRIEVCKISGFKASEICPETKFIEATPNGDKTPLCPYHKIIHFDQEKEYRVNLDCASPDEITTETRFVLPTVMEKYYKTRNPFYKVLPPFKEGCGNPAEGVLEIIYPENHTEIFLPRDLASTKKKVVFKAAHRQNDMTLFWFMDESFIGTTKGFHKISISPVPGEHSLTVTDERGISINRHFRVIGKKG